MIFAKHGLIMSKIDCKIIRSVMIRLEQIAGLIFQLANYFFSRITTNWSE